MAELRLRVLVLNTQGWDTDNYFESTWDTYDNTFEDEIFEFHGSTVEIQLNKS